MIVFLPLLSIFAGQTSCSSRLIVSGFAVIIIFLLVLLDIPLIGRLLVVAARLPVVRVERHTLLFIHNGLHVGVFIVGSSSVSASIPS